MSSEKKKARLQFSPELLLCNACGTQFDVTSGKDECRICDDPRQYVPPEGQSFTTLGALQGKHRNVWWQDKYNSRIWFFKTEPHFAIGERAEIIQTSHGNVMFDLVPFLDQETVDKIDDLGGLEAIIISHPHYYSTWAEWSRTFGCPVYVGAPDEEWLERTGTPGADLRLLTEMHTSIPVKGNDAGVTAILAGGHFPGSLMLHWENYLFIADTVWSVPSALNPVPGKQGVISFTFFYSLPNRIPLRPDEILQVWTSVKDLNFDSTLGAFKGMDVYTQENEVERKTGGVKGRMLESAKIFVRSEGWSEHPILLETLAGSGSKPSVNSRDKESLARVGEAKPETLSFDL